MKSLIARVFILFLFYNTTDKITNARVNLHYGENYKLVIQVQHGKYVWKSLHQYCTEGALCLFQLIARGNYTAFQIRFSLL